jgi:acetate kinase
MILRIYSIGSGMVKDKIMKYLIVNTGSVSSKYSLYNEDSEIFFGHFEIEVGKAIVTFFNGGRSVKGVTRAITDKIFHNSLSYFIQEAIDEQIIKSKDDIFSIGVRTVAPGTYFQSDRIVDAEFMEKITEQREEAPLHVNLTLKELENIKNIFPKTPIIGISDSAFHRDVPDTSRYYAIPKKVAEDYDVYHFGYHGISIGSIVKKVSKQSIGSKVVICHLGGGSSIVAVKDGKSFDTSMGYSPLQGLITSTRAGDIDPVAVMYLGQKMGKDTTELEAYFNTECGLIGLSQVSSDVRDLIEVEKTNEDAKLALDKFVIAIKKYIGGYAAEMGGIDALIFSGTIGERSFIIRGRILQGLDFLGIKIDKKLNDSSVGIDSVLSTNDSKVKVLVVRTDEMVAMAEQLKKFSIS